MNTCKAALRILHARKLYVIIYLVWIGAMMLGISWQIMHASRNADSTTYQPSAAQVAIIDRDADADGLASSLRSYLSTDSEIVDIADDDESLQQAVASNYVDLIAIIPKGFAERYQRYLNETDGSAAQPAIETVVSYTSGSGSLAQLKVNRQYWISRRKTSRNHPSPSSRRHPTIPIPSSRPPRHSQAPSKPACIRSCWSCRYARSW